MMESTVPPEDQRAAARRTLTTLLIMVSALFVGSVLFMVVRGDRGTPGGRPVLAVLPFQGSDPGAGSDPYGGFGEGLAAYFGRADPNVLGVFGPASTSRYVEAGDDPLAVGMALGADMVLVGREVPGGVPVILVAEVFRVDDGTVLWRGEFEVGADVESDRRLLLTRVATEVTEFLGLPR
jgi:TolB-like protein